MMQRCCIQAVIKYPYQVSIISIYSLIFIVAGFVAEFYCTAGISQSTKVFLI